tara:strand:- start:11100 stop:11366 length:267 start_codon:yes stop_codon:yes gene_type:complete
MIHRDFLAGLGETGTVTLNRADCEAVGIECPEQSRQITVEELRKAVAAHEAAQEEVDVPGQQSENDAGDDEKPSTAKRQTKRKAAAEK